MPSPTMRSVPRPWLWVGAITALGLLVRLYRLDAYPLWTDEIFSFNLARLPLRKLPVFQGQTPP